MRRVTVVIVVLLLIPVAAWAGSNRDRLRADPEAVIVATLLAAELPAGVVPPGPVELRVGTERSANGLGMPDVDDWAADRAGGADANGLTIDYVAMGDGYVVRPSGAVPVARGAEGTGGVTPETAVVRVGEGDVAVYVGQTSASLEMVFADGEPWMLVVASVVPADPVIHGGRDAPPRQCRISSWGFRSEFTDPQVTGGGPFMGSTFCAVADGPVRVTLLRVELRPGARYRLPGPVAGDDGRLVNEEAAPIVYLVLDLSASPARGATPSPS